MAYNEWHNLNNLDECVQSMSLNVGTGKLHAKIPSEKWVGKSLTTFYAVVVFVAVVFVLCFRFLTLILLSF